ncbi:unnamed protein product, partial [Iphiclides podalirius]
MAPIVLFVTLLLCLQANGMETQENNLQQGVTAERHGLLSPWQGLNGVLPVNRLPFGYVSPLIPGYGTHTNFGRGVPQLLHLG